VKPTYDNKTSTILLAALKHKNGYCMSWLVTSLSSVLPIGIEIT